MKTCLLAGTVIGALVVPAAAADTFYVTYDKTAKQCTISKSAPTESESISMMGQYGSEADAKTPRPVASN